MKEIGIFRGVELGGEGRFKPNFNLLLTKHHAPIRCCEAFVAIKIGKRWFSVCGNWMKLFLLVDILLKIHTA